MRSAVVGLFLVGASACDKGGFVQFEVRNWAPNFAGDFSTGDFVADGQRVSASRVVLVDSDWPGLDCVHLAPSFDDTDFLKCARPYAKARGTERWVEVQVPVESATFLGQDRDGARYFFEPGWLWVMPKDSAGFLPRVEVPQNFGEPAMHPFGILLFNEGAGRAWWRPQAFEWELLMTGTLRTFRKNAFSQPVKARFIDADGNFFEQTMDGYDRVSPDGTKREAGWFKRPTTNQVYDTLGIGGDGRLYGLSTAKTNVTGVDTRKDNEIPIEAMMAMSHGDAEWTQVSEAISSAESRAIGFGLEKPYDAFPGRDGSWWLAKCIANCSPTGANNAHQSNIWQWRKPGTEKSSPVQTKYTVWRGRSVTLQLPKHGDVRIWKLGSVSDSALTAETAGVSSLTLAAARTAQLGVQSVTLTNEGGPSQVFEIEVKGVDTVALEKPRRLTYTSFAVLSAGTRTIWLDVNGVVHARDGAGVSTSIPGVPPAQSVEGQYVHALDGRVLVLGQTANTQGTFTVTELNVPPIHSLHEGLALSRDGTVYLLLADGGAPVQVLTRQVSIASRQYLDTQNGSRLTTFGSALDGDGLETLIEHRQGFLEPMVTPVTEWRGIARVGHGGTAVGHDGRLLVDAKSYGTSALKSFDSVFRSSGQVGGEMFAGAFPLVVTGAGEAWVVGAWLHPIQLPAGRTAEVMVAGGPGELLWLDDGSVFQAAAPDAQSPSSSPVATPFDLPTLARPSP